MEHRRTYGPSIRNKGRSAVTNDSPAVPDDGPKTFWGKALGLTAGGGALVVLLPAGLVSGVISATKGDTFDSGFNKACDSLADRVDKAADFGDRHSDTITKAVISGVIAAGIRTATGGHSQHPTNSSGTM